MKRATLLLTGLGLVLVLVGWYLLVWSPRAEAITTAEAQIVEVQAQQATTQARIGDLQGVRETAPQLQAELAAAESLVPGDTALPSALRQLQTAADESGATLVSVAAARTQPVGSA
jgi:type II secretory pathway component PulM